MNLESVSPTAAPQARPSRRTDLDFTFRLVPLILRWLEARGVPASRREQLLEGLPDGAAKAAEITAPLADVRAFLDGADAVAQTPSLGLALAAAVPRGTYAWIEFIARLSTTLEEGMSAVSRYYRLVNKGAQIATLEQPGLCGLEIKVHGRREGWGRHLNEYTVALFHRISQELLPEWKAVRLWFSHPAPADDAVEALTGFFGVTPTFSAATSGFLGPLELADRRLTSGDLTLQRLLEKQADEVLIQKVPLAEFPSKVRDVVCRRLGKSEVSIETIAEALAMSPRTLQRRLGAEGLSFQAVLDGAREQFAKGYLGKQALGVSEIAYLLGYSELRAFDRAFRRWTGQTPSEWRRIATR